MMRQTTSAKAPQFAASITGDRAKLGTPETGWGQGKRVCVSGSIRENRGKPEIIPGIGLSVISKLDILPFRKPMSLVARSTGVLPFTG
jgi:hypothetical protein